MSPVPEGLPRVAATGLLLALVVPLGLFGWGGWTGVHVPEALEYGEPFIVSAAYNLAMGGSLYAPVEDLPFLHNNYNPLVQSLAAPMLASTGPSYVPQRAITFGSVLVLLLVVGWIVYRETRSLWAAAVAGLLPLTSGFVFPWFCLGRVDCFAVLCSTLGVACAFRRRTDDPGYAVGFLVFAWLAFAAKQSVVGGAGAVVLCSLLQGRARASFRLGFAFFLGCAAQVGLFAFLTDGEYWRHAVTYNAAHERVGIWPAELPPWLMAKAVGPTVLGLLLVALPFVRWRKDAPWLCWLGVSFALALMLLRKSGTHVHYLLEPICAASVLGVTVGTRVLRDLANGSRTRARAASVGVLALLALSVFPLAYARTWPRARYYAELVAREDVVPEEVASRIRKGAGPPLLFAKTGSLAIQAGRAAIFDIADFVRLQRSKNWKASDRLLTLVETRHFPVIGVQLDLGDAEHFSPERIPELMPAIREHYRRLDVGMDDKLLGRAEFWVPKE